MNVLLFNSSQIILHSRLTGILSFSGFTGHLKLHFLTLAERARLGRLSFIFKFPFFKKLMDWPGLITSDRLVGALDSRFVGIFDSELVGKNTFPFWYFDFCLELILVLFKKLCWFESFLKLLTFLLVMGPPCLLTFLTISLSYLEFPFFTSKFMMGWTCSIGPSFLKPGRCWRKLWISWGLDVIFWLKLGCGLVYWLLSWRFFRCWLFCWSCCDWIFCSKVFDSGIWEVGCFWARWGLFDWGCCWVCAVEVLLWDWGWFWWDCGWFLGWCWCWF